MSEIKELTVDELHHLIVNQADEFDLALIESAVVFRRKQLGITTAETAVAEQTETERYEIGDRIEFNDKTYKYLKGVQGEVVKVNQKSVQMRVDVNPRARRYSGLTMRCPNAIIQKASNPWV